MRLTTDYFIKSLLKNPTTSKIEIEILVHITRTCIHIRLAALLTGFPFKNAPAYMQELDRKNMGVMLVQLEKFLLMIVGCGMVQGGVVWGQGLGEV